MDTPSCVPSNPAPPQGTPFYSFTALQVVPTFSRASYLSKFGVQAPNFDSTKPVKLWFATGFGPGEKVVFNVLSDVWVGTIGTLTMTAEDVAAVNIPGLVSYHPYTPDPTSAVMNSGTGVNPDTLSNYSDALALAAAWGLGPNSVFDADWAFGPYSIVYPPTETRRMWAIALAGQAIIVGVKIAEMYSKGVGHPGSWDMDTAEPTWIPALDPADGIHTGVQSAQVPVPIRALLNTEKVVQGFMGAQIQNQPN